MRRAISIIFLSIITAGMVIPYVFFAVRLHQIHQQKRSELKYLPASSLEAIRMPVHQFNLLVDDDEISWHDQMYDIAFTERQGDEVIIYALHDADEDSLLSLMDAILESSLEDKKQIPVSGLGFLTCELAVAFQLPEMVGVQVVSKTGFNSQIPSSPTIVPSPPPKLG